MFMDMDKMVGKDFEAGLAKMKSVVEAGGAARSPMRSEPDAQ